jgi:hypothetical protein
MDLLKISLDPNFNISINFYLLIIIIVILIIFILIKLFSNKTKIVKSFEIDEANIGIGQHTIKFKPNSDDLQIAYKFWVEISTRKIGLPIDFENDVIYEIYNSWYEFFKITREMVKDIPIIKIIKSDSTKKLVNLSITILNDGLRPHLTLWQAKYRRWYEIEIANDRNIEKSPQDIQKCYSEYDKLIEDMNKVNVKLLKYRELLYNLVFGEQIKAK